MNIKQLIEKLRKYNPEARICVVVHNRDQPFRLRFGGADGGAEKEALTVDFCVVGSNTDETITEEERRADELEAEHGESSDSRWSSSGGAP